MSKIFANSEEKFLKSVVLYGKASDNYVYFDDTYANKVDKDTLFNLCNKKLVTVLYGSAYFTPVTFSKNTTKNCTDVTFWNTTATTAAAVTLHSKEYT